MSISTNTAVDWSLEQFLQEMSMNLQLGMRPARARDALKPQRPSFGGNPSATEWQSPC